MRSQNGYSLVETLVAVSLLLMVASLAVLRFGGLRTRSQLRAAAYRLAADLRLAEQRTALEGLPWELALDAGAGAASGYRLYYQGSGGWSPYLLHGQAAAVALPAGVVVGQVTPAGGAVTPGGAPADGVQFTPAAGAPRFRTVFTLADAAGDQYQVSVREVTGFVEVCSPICT